METFDDRFDVYIGKSADFAKPILNHIRNIVHQACPDIKETIKWGFPNFDYKGIVCNMASFKNHCSFGFWKSSLLHDPHNLLKDNVKNAMGQFGRITSIADLPPDEIIIEYIKNAVQLNEDGVKVKPKRVETPKTPIETPPYFTKALSENSEAKTYFESMSNSHKREYLEWIKEAKTEETRLKRMATSIEWLSEGKSLNWKYQKK